MAKIYPINNSKFQQRSDNPDSSYVTHLHLDNNDKSNYKQLFRFFGPLVPQLINLFSPVDHIQRPAHPEFPRQGGGLIPKNYWNFCQWMLVVLDETNTPIQVISLGEQNFSSQRSLNFGNFCPKMSLFSVIMPISSHWRVIDSLLVA